MGAGVFKIDYALDGPIPWKAAECARSATVHVGGTIEEIAAHEHAVFHGTMTDKPFVLVARQSMFDSTRAPEGKHTGWAYCHVPHGSTEDATEAIERQIERFAPGFRDRILARRTINTAQYQEHNPNMVGGDIAGGANTMSQFLTRPFPRLDPYSTPNDRSFICSSSTPPGSAPIAAGATSTAPPTRGATSASASSTSIPKSTSTRTTTTSSAAPSPCTATTASSTTAGPTA
jgi:phytoene dehydrogenase-like protein